MPANRRPRGRRFNLRRKADRRELCSLVLSAGLVKENEVIGIDQVHDRFMAYLRDERHVQAVMKDGLDDLLAENAHLRQQVAERDAEIEQLRAELLQMQRQSVTKVGKRKRSRFEEDFD